MAIELKQQLRISQQLVMTPQLQQAIKLLQLNQLGFVNLVEQELRENPCLRRRTARRAESWRTRRPARRKNPRREAAASEGEAESSEAETPEAPSPDGEGPAGDRPLGGARLHARRGSGRGHRGQRRADGRREDRRRRVGRLHGLSPADRPRGRVGGEDDERRSLEATLTRRPTLTHLDWQIHLSDFDEEEAAIAEWIISNLDERYLCATVEEIAKAHAPVEQVEAVLMRVQQLDPPGVAARDLRECLMRQVDALKLDDRLVVRIIDEHLDLLQKRDCGLAAPSTPAPRRWRRRRRDRQPRPRPGRAFGGEDPVYITPDIHVYKVGDEFHVLLNEDGLPKLKINNVYKDVLARDGKIVEDAKGTRTYVQDKVRSAMWLIKSIHQRQRTIYKVMQSIIRHQREFFEQGVAYLKPLNLRDVADDIQMHERPSVASRPTSTCTRPRGSTSSSTSSTRPSTASMATPWRARASRRRSARSSRARTPPSRCPISGSPRS